MRDYRQIKQVTKIKICLLGNSKTGKTTFLQTSLTNPQKLQNPTTPSIKQNPTKALANMLSSPKTSIPFLKNPQDKNSTSTNMNKSMFTSTTTTTNTNSLTYDFQIHEKKILQQIYQLSICQIRGDVNIKDTDKRLDNFIAKVNLFILFFDVNNNQSFLDLSREWLTYANSASKGAIVCVVANKVDRGFTVSYKSMMESFQNQGIKVFLNSYQVNPRKTLDDIILSYQSSLILKQIRQYYEPQKKQHLFEKLFKTKADDKDNVRLKKLEQSYIIRYEQLKENCRNLQMEMKMKVNCKQKQFKKNVMNVFKMSTGYCLSDISEEEDMEGFMRKFGQKLTIQHQDMRNMQQKQINLHSQNEQLSQKNTHLTQHITHLTQTIQSTTLTLFKTQQQLQTTNKIIKQQQYKIKQHMNCIQEQKNKIKQLHKQLSKMRDLHNIQSLKSISNQYQVAEELTKVSCVLSDTEEKLVRIQGKLGEVQGELRGRVARQAFWDGMFFRNFQLQLLNNLKASIEKCKGKQIKQCIKVYQFNLCWNTNFHSLLDNYPNLLYILELPKTTLIVFIQKPLMNNTSGKQAKFYLHSQENKSLIELQTTPESQLWRYDPIYLIFGKEHINVRFRKEECSVMIVEKKNRMFVGRPTVVQVLGLPNKPEGEKLVYPVSRFQVLRVQFF